MRAKYIKELKQQIERDDKEIYDMMQLIGGYKYDSQAINKAIIERIKKPAPVKKEATCI